MRLAFGYRGFDKRLAEMVSADGSLEDGRRYKSMKRHVHVSRLRSKIDKGFDRPLIHTIRGAGYMVRDSAGARA